MSGQSFVNYLKKENYGLLFFCMKCKIKTAVFGFAEGQRLLQPAEFLMPGFNRIITGGQMMQRIESRAVADTVKRMSNDADISFHPRMDVAANWNHDFSRGEGSLSFRCFDGHAEIESLVRFRLGMHVVKRFVAVDQAQGLADLNAENVRHKPAALLVEHDRGRGGLECEAIDSLFKINENVFQRTVAIDHDLFRGSPLSIAGGTSPVRSNAKNTRRRSSAGEKDMSGNDALTSNVPR